MNLLARLFAIVLLQAGLFCFSCRAAQEPAQPGVSSSEIKIGNITCYTGWAKEYAAVARAEAA